MIISVAARPQCGRSTLLLALLLTVPRVLPAQQAAPAPDARRLAWLDNVLAETSGLVASRAYRGILWSHNDSGNDCMLFAIDTTGTVRARFTLAGVQNRDWEDLALGPCPRGTCLYLADTGDNGENDATVTVYRFPEPNPGRPATIRRLEEVVLRYPDRPRDVEAVFVSPDTVVHLVSKGLRSPVAHYRIPAAAWRMRDTVIAEPHAITTGIFRGKLVTGAALAPDGRTVAILTYRDVHRMRLMPDGTLVWEAPTPACDLEDRLPQAEAVTWLDEAILLLSSEQRLLTKAQLLGLRCWP